MPWQQQRLPLRCSAAQQAGAAAAPGSAAAPPQQLLGLKEWAVANAALGAGEQTILLRKVRLQACVKPFGCMLCMIWGPLAKSTPPSSSKRRRRPSPAHPTPQGGIKEPCFKPPARAFLLFPTSFHSEAQLLKPGVAQRYAAAAALEPKAVDVIPIAQYVEVTGAWTTADERVLEVRGKGQLAQSSEPQAVFFTNPPSSGLVASRR